MEIFFLTFPYSDLCKGKSIFSISILRNKGIATVNAYYRSTFVFSVFKTNFAIIGNLPNFRLKVLSAFKLTCVEHLAFQEQFLNRISSRDEENTVCQVLVSNIIKSVYYECIFNRFNTIQFVFNESVIKYIIMIQFILNIYNEINIKQLVHLDFRFL